MKTIYTGFHSTLNVNLLLMVYNSTYSHTILADFKKPRRLTCKRSTGNNRAVGYTRRKTYPKKAMVEPFYMVSIIKSLAIEINMKECLLLNKNGVTFPTGR